MVHHAVSKITAQDGRAVLVRQLKKLQVYCLKFVMWPQFSVQRENFPDMTVFKAVLSRYSCWGWGVGGLASVRIEKVAASTHIQGADNVARWFFLAY